MEKTIAQIRESLKKVKAPVKDIFFLDMEAAYSEAVKQNEIIGVDGKSRLQYCYYDGLLTDITLTNFINISSDNFVEAFSHNHLPIPQLIAISQDGEVIFNDMPVDIIDEIEQYRAQRNVSQYIHQDTYFVDPLLALNVAKQRNRVYCGHPTIDGLQVCYYRGELPDCDIENLFHVELEMFQDFFTVSRLRLPEFIDMPNELEDELKQAVKEDVAQLIKAVQSQRYSLTRQLAIHASNLKPFADMTRPLRVLFATSRLTTVMQYASLNVAKVFEKKGYEILFYIDDETMGYNPVDYMSQYIEFNPDIVFTINHVNHVSNFNDRFLNDDVVNIIWWQDPMPLIKKHQPIAWRDKDYNFSISPVLDDHLKQCGANEIIRQQFVIDDEVFNTDGAGEREDKVVFVGSSYGLSVKLDDVEQQNIIAQLLDILKSSGRCGQDEIQHLAETSKLSYDFIFWSIWHYVIRDYSVRWLCENTAIPVEIYGRYWDNDPVVKNYYKGELAHGADVAAVYKKAKYALVSHPFEINSQRLAEVAACGCIPIVYDCRDIAEKPHWDDYCLFFKNQDDLNKILASRAVPKKSPNIIAESFTYQHAVESFIKHAGIANILSGLGA